MGTCAGSRHTYTDIVKLSKSESQKFLQESPDCDSLITKSIFFWTLVFQLFIADCISQN